MVIFVLQGVNVTAYLLTHELTSTLAPSTPIISKELLLRVSCEIPSSREHPINSRSRVLDWERWGIIHRVVSKQPWPIFQITLVISMRSTGRCELHRLISWVNIEGLIEVISLHIHQRSVAKMVIWSGLIHLCWSYSWVIISKPITRRDTHHQIRMSLRLEIPSRVHLFLWNSSRVLLTSHFILFLWLLFVLLFELRVEVETVLRHLSNTGVLLVKGRTSVSNKAVVRFYKSYAMSQTVRFPSEMARL